MGTRREGSADVEHIEFVGSPGATLGVEVELQILNWKGYDLCTGAPRLLKHLAKSSRLEHASIKPELFQSMIEVNTGICPSVADVRRDLGAAFGQLLVAGEPLGLEFASAGSHAFARYDKEVVFPSERFRYVLDRNRFLGRRLVIFGLHVHVGVRDGDTTIAMMNAMLPKASYLLALSGSSPFWDSDDTGLASSRTTVFESMPTAGTPPTFASWAEFERHAHVMTTSGSIGSLKDFWWDVRPSPSYGTLEIRICDALPTLSETVAVVAFVQSMMARFDDMRQSGHPFPPPNPWLLRENKWRATRWGLDAEVVVDDRGRTRPIRAEIERLLFDCEPYAAALGCGAELARVGSMLDRPSYKRQREVFRRTRSYVAVVQSLAHEFATDEWAS